MYIYAQLTVDLKNASPEPSAVAPGTTLLNISKEKELPTGNPETSYVNL